MSKKPKESNRPTHAIWQVTGEGDKSRWNRVGSAWMHKDAKGANLIFDSIPLSGRVVVREITELDNTADDGAANQGGQQ
jgi:hypothetical protein